MLPTGFLVEKVAPVMNIATLKSISYWSADPGDDLAVANVHNRPEIP